jgi:hypothetical protein
MGLCGNAITPLIYGKLADLFNARTAYWILIPCYLYLIFYATYGHKIKYWTRPNMVHHDKIKIINGRLITPFRIIEQGTILIEDNKIVYVGNETQQDVASIY